MADSPKKRKERTGGDGAERGGKRSKGGSGGKWQTPHQQAKVAARGAGKKIEPGDVGIWATCARNQEGRATVELKAMLEECAERFYGIKSGPDEVEDEEEEDIEVSIQKELAGMDKKQDKSTKLFTPVHVDLACVLFFKTQPTINPVDLVHRICKEVASNPKIRRMRYVNRLTPMTVIGKATEKGLDEVSKLVLSKYFNLNVQKDEGEAGGDDDLDQLTCIQYAIRPTIRNHNTLNRDAVIKQIASLIADTHKVDLTNSDKVILVDIYQTVCGMSVVGSDWEALKRFNLSELYSHNQPTTKTKDASNAEAKPQSATTGEDNVAIDATDNAEP
ncbi:hypothetical protein BDZ45DRAFT_700739 [Acephala macrosclerotiorum]|nr:hypothetical protein BDZ45DRAFT_700739 [Acephala macrosclerotiorum]